MRATQLRRERAAEAAAAASSSKRARNGAGSQSAVRQSRSGTAGLDGTQQDGLFPSGYSTAWPGECRG